MTDTEVRMIRYTMEQLSAELQDTKQYVSDIKSKLERTRKALEIAVRSIKTIKYSKKSDAINLRHKANKALIEIYKIIDQPALEQKE